MAANKSIREAADILARWRDSPVDFVAECIGATPDGWQTAVLADVAAANRVVMKASKGPGKSTVLAWCVWWWLATRVDAKVVCTSISADNLRDGLWSELALWRSQSDVLRAAFSWSAERIASVDRPETWWASARAWSRSADVGQQANTLAGVHADAVMFVLDEAGGIPDAVVAAAEAGLANADPGSGREARLLLAGNPTHTSGPLWRACMTEAHLWEIHEITGDPDAPNRAPRVSAEWARQQIEKYGRENNWVRVNVFGEFPSAQSDSLIARDVAMAAMSRPPAISHAPVILGVDVARYGDDRSVVAARRGAAIIDIHTYREMDLMSLASEVVRRRNQYDAAIIAVDQTGLGAGVVDRLRQLRANVAGVDFGARAVSDPKKQNRRVEMWAAMAEWLRNGGSLPAIDGLADELTAPTYWFDAQGRMCLEAKADIKARGLPSPDIADAIALTFAVDVPISHSLRESIKATNVTSVHEYDPMGA